MKILVTGSNGQLGSELKQAVPGDWQAYFWDVDDLDITSEVDVKEKLAGLKPDVIVNAAAYTAVDAAESDEELAYAVNETGALNLARVSQQLNAKLVHVSTDFVFNGQQSSPYLVTDTPAPLSVYGKSKRQGELAVQEVLGDDALIIRTSWVYSAHGNNFVKTMLRLMADRDELGIVSDQIGTPTWAASLAAIIVDMIRMNASGLYHWSDAGVASWYDFAVAIMEEAVAQGKLQKAIKVNPIRTEDYPVAATRPPYSVLDKSTIIERTGYYPEHWRVSLRKMIGQL